MLEKMDTLYLRGRFEKSLFISALSEVPHKEATAKKVEPCRFPTKMLTKLLHLDKSLALPS
ncbi:hypothetical protein AV654_19960 [Paenibacillus elgii]|uniref:Uncharacterized protein n=1 Tax=Paenibacillus elgii TaxID=189691 RepID=A0A163XGL8_9BACL|nr:hypothetical protein AV654_19960 [Paenibacillus elgii]